MEYGRKNSAVRTAEQTMIADFWHLNVQWYTNELTRKVKHAHAVWQYMLTGTNDT